MESAKGLNPEFLTTGKLAKRLSVLPATVNIWARSGKIPHYNISNHYYYKWAEVEEWLAYPERAESSITEEMTVNSD